MQSLDDGVVVGRSIVGRIGGPQEHFADLRVLQHSFDLFRLRQLLPDMQRRADLNCCEYICRPQLGGGRGRERGLYLFAVQLGCRCLRWR